jgi:hypothetical protein
VLIGFLEEQEHGRPSGAAPDEAGGDPSLATGAGVTVPMALAG